MSSTFSGYIFRSTILILSFLSLTHFAHSQSNRFQIWTDFNARFELKNRFQANVEPGYRIEPDIGAQTAYLRAILRYSPNRIFSFDLGAANFNYWGYEVINSIELRTFQFVFLNWPELWEFDFKFRLGLEQRWFAFPELSANEFVHRARLRIGLTSPYFDFWEGVSKLYVTSNYEVLRDVNDEAIDVLIDENRAMLGVGYLNNKNLRAEFHYQIMGLRDRDAGELIRDINLIRFRVFYYLRSNKVNPE